MRRVVYCLLLIGLAGCAGTLTGTVAVYTHPQTGQVMECVKEPSMAQGGGGAIGSVIATEPYAECKSALEGQGYRRTGTYSLPYTDQPEPSSATPRPAAVQKGR